MAYCGSIHVFVQTSVQFCWNFNVEDLNLFQLIFHIINITFAEDNGEYPDKIGKISLIYILSLSRNISLSTLSYSHKYNSLQLSIYIAIWKWMT